MGTTCAFSFPKLGAFQSPIFPQEIMLFVSCFIFCFCLFFIFFIFSSFFLSLSFFSGFLVLFFSLDVFELTSIMAECPHSHYCQDCDRNAVCSLIFALTSSLCQELMKGMLWCQYHGSCCLKFVKHVLLLFILFISFLFLFLPLFWLGFLFTC
jgi:hypothetical protein